MTLKNGVTRAGVQPQIWYAIGIMDVLYRMMGASNVVTSLTDSHGDKPKSLHNVGLAADLRTSNLSKDRWPELVSRVKQWLEPMGYDVVLESNHLHIEYDPLDDESWIKFSN